MPFEILIASDFIIGIACGITWRMLSEHSDVASSAACFMLEAAGIVSTVLSLRSAGIVFADCSLRQGAGGREFARLGSRTWFLR